METRPIHLTPPDTIELHDANIENITFVAASCEVVIVLAAYRSLHDRKRTRLTVHFLDVEMYSSTVYPAALAGHASAGHVQHWSTTDGSAGLTSIFLVDGLVSINAGSVKAAFDEANEGVD